MASVKHFKRAREILRKTRARIVGAPQEQEVCVLGCKSVMRYLQRGYNGTARVKRLVCDMDVTVRLLLSESFQGLVERAERGAAWALKG